MFHKVQTTILILIILASALLWAVAPQSAPVAMRRESLTPDLIIQPADLYTALDMSLAAGDGRLVNFGPFGLSWEV